MRVRFCHTKVLQRTLHELLDLTQPASNASVESVGCLYKLEEARSVHLHRRQVGQRSKLLGV